MSAFALPPASAASSFTPARLTSRAATPLDASRRRAAAAPSRRPAVTMIQNPFKNNKDTNQGEGSTFMAPQAGDPGYVPPPPVPKGTGMVKSEPPKAEKKEEDAPAATAGGKTGGKTETKSVTPKAKPAAGGKLPVSAGDVKRGLDLLKEDLLKNAPQRAGVGRQDVSAVMKPMAGEPGFKPAAYQTVKVSELGISPFPEDANAVGKVGGIEAVKKAAVEVKAGKKSASDIKKEVLKVEVKAEKEQVFDIPDYLKPLPEDTPRKGYTWKNYIGR